MSTLEARTVEAATLPAAAREQPAGRSTAWWGMVLLIATEAAFFAVLLASYFYLRFASPGPWPPDGIEDPKLVRPLIMTGLLLTSSIPMIWADRQVRKGHVGRTAAGVSLSVVLGLAFLALQGSEYAEKLHQFTPTTNVYGSLFYSITGFHGLHVLVGLVMMVFLLAGAARHRLGGHHFHRVQLTAFYWHFVDVVWIFILSSLYLSPHL
ncbi:MAG TPA: cytochrome c oxidase subunit 3 [Pseudonocardiaceae bacterium]|nr:cytochrome c oxidase subunit 3 [Pseudonocardiaceae bacterium]